MSESKKNSKSESTPPIVIADETNTGTELGPGDMDAAPSEMPQPVDIPDPPTASQLVVKSTNPSSVSGSVAGPAASQPSQSGLPGQATSQSGPAYKLTQMTQHSRSHSSHPSQHSHSGHSHHSKQSQQAAREPTSSRPLTGPPNMGASVLGSSEMSSHMSKGASGAGGSMNRSSSKMGASQVEGSRAEGSKVEGSKVEGSRAEGSRVEGSRAEGSRAGGSQAGGSQAGGSQSKKPMSGTGSQMSKGPQSSPKSGTGSQAGGSQAGGSQAGSPDGGLDEGGAQMEEQGQEGSQAPASGSQQHSGTAAAGGSSRQEPSTIMSSQAAEAFRQGTTGSAATSGSKSGKPNDKKVTRFRYHKRITVRTSGKNNPQAIMNKVNKGVSPSTIGEIDTSDLMKRVGIKDTKHWRIRVRQTKRITKNGKTTTQTKTAYRDSSGNLQPPPGTCKKCGKKESECKCNETPSTTGK